MATIDAYFTRQVMADLMADAVAVLQRHPPKTKAASRDKYHNDPQAVWRRRRIGAACWLASSEATPWFELLGYNQADKLRYIGWPEQVAGMLEDPVYLAALGPSRERMLREGVAELEKGAEG